MPAGNKAANAIRTHRPVAPTPDERGPSWDDGMDTSRQEDHAAARRRAGVGNAFALVRFMQPGRPVPTRVAVLHASGALLAMQTLGGMDQARLLRDLLAPLGFREIDPTPEQAAYGCRMVLQWSEEESRVQTLLSGGPPVLWPLRS